MKEDVYYRELKGKEEDISNFGKAVETFKRQNHEYKRNIMEME